LQSRPGGRPGFGKRGYAHCAACPAGRRAGQRGRRDDPARRKRHDGKPVERSRIDQLAIVRHRAGRVAALRAARTGFDRAESRGRAGSVADLGSLSANGQVFLVNPNGVLFGSGAQVSVGGIVASTLQLSDADFLAGRIAFSRGPRAGEVVNQGSVTAASGGYVAFLGPQVRNEGVINARLGTVVLAAGERATLNFADNRLVSFAVDAGALDALAENRHLIQADGGQVVLTAKAADALARSVVNNTGIVQATTIAEQNGVIRLEGGAISNSGTISAAGGGRIMLAAERDITLAPTSLITASGARGGDVTLQARSGTLLTDGRIEAAGTDAQGGTLRLLGDRVGLVNSASVDASGASGGGTVLAGGDYQGKNPDVQNATHTYAGPQTSIRADATASGDGGKVILWADDTTRFYGAISARGGPAGGNGGFVETSGKRFLDAQGLADASAPRGVAGQWLLDPNNITIQTAGSDTNVTASPNFTSTNDNAIVTTGSIQTALNAGTSVTVTTASAGANTQAGDITVANAISKTAGGNATLTLTATNGITFSAGANVTSTTGQLGLALTAGTGGITSLQAVNTNGGALTLNSTGSMTQSGVISGAGTVVKQGSGTLTLSSANTYTGATTVSAGDARGHEQCGARHDRRRRDGGERRDAGPSRRDRWAPRRSR
jgi:autotransporter-associated beta strand protein